MGEQNKKSFYNRKLLKHFTPNFIIKNFKMIFSAGKSSMLNCLFGVSHQCRKSGAITSKTPGRTQMVNMFHLVSPRKKVRLVLADLPGILLFFIIERFFKYCTACSGPSSSGLNIFFTHPS